MTYRSATQLIIFTLIALGVGQLFFWVVHPSIGWALVVGMISGWLAGRATAASDDDDDDGAEEDDAEDLEVVKP